MLIEVLKIALSATFYKVIIGLRAEKGTGGISLM